MLGQQAVQIAKGFYNNMMNKETDLYNTRIAICIPCKSYNPDGLLGPMCNECGCVLQSKCRLIEATCPKDK